MILTEAALDLTWPGASQATANGGQGMNGLASRDGFNGFREPNGRHAPFTGMGFPLHRGGRADVRTRNRPISLVSNSHISSYDAFRRAPPPDHTRTAPSVHTGMWPSISRWTSFRPACPHTASSEPQARETSVHMAAWSRINKLRATCCAWTRGHSDRA
ncbi:hypothetical protein SKAU_G00405820 [Synaphobranchus kaupii]|uniref:Uncharacterized protein n=1 Tax=Synaphobranchus kaupii TaxID=118154 RepID=A0A9Q1E9Z9_SYNKA|nr:hypothetical protein SKAU_G00405820 [Synaphobranchus kaupii]